MMDVRYILTRGGERMEFRTMVEVSESLGITIFRVRNALDGLETPYGWSIGREYVERDERFVGVAPDGRAVKFKTSVEAAHLLGTLPSPIVKAADRRGKHGSWRFYHASEYEGGNIVPFSVELKKTFVPNLKKDKAVAMNDGDEYEGREPIARGYYMQGFDPCICPMCKKVIRDFNGSGERHLLRCLRGHEYRIKFGVIKVYK